MSELSVSPPRSPRSPRSVGSRSVTISLDSPKASHTVKLSLPASMDAEPVARTVSTTEGDPAAAPDVKLLQNRVATLEQMLVERDAFISQLFAKTHPGADGAAPSVTPRQPPPTVDVEAPPLAKAEEADGDASPKNVASVPASDERAPTVAFAAPLCVEPPPASVAV